MKTGHIFLAIGAAFILFTSFLPFPGGAPSPYNYSSSPADGRDCSWCHGSASNVTGWITSNIPASGYVPGTTYQITATNSGPGSGKYGFEISPQDLSGNLLGTLAAGTNSKLVGSGKWITHSTSSTSVSSWVFNWTAPPVGTGSVTFYGSFSRSEGSATRNSTLTVNEAAGSAPGPAGPITGPDSVCIESTANYSITPVTGATSYVWTVPAGTNIVSGQGTLSITLQTNSSSTTGVISVYGSNANGNGSPASLNLTVQPLPGPIAGINGPSQVYPYVNSTTEFTTDGSSNAAFYLWELTPVESGTIEGESTAAIVNWNLTYSGLASIRAKGINDCGDGAWSDTKEVWVIDNTSVSETGLQLLSLFPVPSDGPFFIRTNLKDSQVPVTIYDHTGKIIQSLVIQGQGLTKVDLPLKPGIYFLSALSGDHVSTHKLIIR